MLVSIKLVKIIYNRQIPRPLLNGCPDWTIAGLALSLRSSAQFSSFLTYYGQIIIFRYKSELYLLWG